MPNASTVSGMRSMVCQLKQAMEKTVSGSVLMWAMTLDGVYSGGGIGGRAQSPVGPGAIVESHCLDKIMLMGYGAVPALPPWNTSLPICKRDPDKCAHVATHGVLPWAPNGNPYQDPALAAGQSSLDSYRYGVQRYLDMGARPSELGILMPWFAKHFPCKGKAPLDGKGECNVIVDSDWNGPTGGEVGYGAALQFCFQSYSGRHWSSDWDCPFCDVPGTVVAHIFDGFEEHPSGIKPRSWQRYPWAIEGQNQSRYHRVYYEDPLSLALKYELAVGAAGDGLGKLGGFGMWTASAAITAMGPTVAWDMWAAVPPMQRVKTDDSTGTQDPQTGAAAWTRLPLTVQHVYKAGVPHTDRIGRLLSKYDPAKSFLPLVVYDPILQCGPLVKPPVPATLRGQSCLPAEYNASLYAGTNFTAALPYPAYGLDMYADTFRAAGLQVIREHPTLDEVNQFNDQPTILGWYLYEEPTGALWTLGQPSSNQTKMAAAFDSYKLQYATIKVIDPVHPVFILVSFHATNISMSETPIRTLRKKAPDGRDILIARNIDKSPSNSISAKITFPEWVGLCRSCSKCAISRW